MKISTRDFGEVEIQEENIYHFSQPIFGFEEVKDYIILNDKEFGDGIAWLQALDNPKLCFIMFDPGTLTADYFPLLPKGSEKLLGEGDCYCWVIAVVPESVKDATVNLKSPVFMNPQNHLAAQIILDGDYPVRFPLTKGGQG
jgi:flagellar assembly factor FliW